jgi:TPP-dependent pyruvate/acetoin dehydrogenase alpha subunit
MRNANKTTWLSYYRTLLLIRYFETRVEDLFTRRLVKGTTHPSTGQEAVAVGACAALGRKDYVTSTHRGHGHFIARGADPRRIMAELYGKKTGYSRGRGGSQLMADFKLGFLGSDGITGGGIPLATGVGLSIKQRKTDQVVLCFFGDGAASQGAFHESLNMAALWKLPVVYLCENNLYAMSSRVCDTVSIEHIADRAVGYGMPGEIVDGNDLLAVKEAVAFACDRARHKDGPTLIEAKTYRLSGHSRGDLRLYRTREEEAVWRERDPIQRFRQFLIQEGALTKGMDSTIKSEARQAVRAAVEFAQRSPYPAPATIEEGVFA